MSVQTIEISFNNTTIYRHACSTLEELYSIDKSKITLGSTAVVGGKKYYLASSQGKWNFINQIQEEEYIHDGTDKIGLDFIYICNSNEYDNQTLIPTISQPEANIFYLVPSNNNSTDYLFDAWIYSNEQWERFSAGKTIGGDTGTTFIPSVSSTGVISWTNDGGETNPASVDLVAAVVNAWPEVTGVAF